MTGRLCNRRTCYSCIHKYVAYLSYSITTLMDKWPRSWRHCAVNLINKKVSLSKRRIESIAFVASRNKRLFFFRVCGELNWAILVRWWTTDRFGYVPFMHRLFSDAVIVLPMRLACCNLTSDCIYLSILLILFPSPSSSILLKNC